MKKIKIYSAEEAALLVKNQDTISVSGFVACGLPETLNTALEKRFIETGSPKNLTLFYAAGLGNRDGSGADHFAHEGMTKRVIGGHWNLAPKLGQLAIENKIEAYNFPQGTLCQLYRDIAAHKVGTITHVGLNTFVDPRNQGGKLNDITTEDMVKLLEIDGKEQLLYKAIPINICFIRGTYADEYGNISLEKEVAPFEVTSLAQATKNSGGKVIVQVETIVRGGTLDPKLVKIPGIYVDGIVLSKEEEHQQCLNGKYDPSLAGEIRILTDSTSTLKLDAKKIIARRAAMELQKDTVVNLGIGAPEYVSAVANEEGIGDFMTLTVEVGPVGGIPQGGTRFGGSINADCVLDQPYQFDFYDGGGVDLAFLGLAQTDGDGNVNVSKFGPRIAGCGGFINITQNAKKVFFCGTFTAGGLKTAVENGKMLITKEGAERKFVNAVEHITFSGKYANKTNQPVMYITERAVFELRQDGVHLIEVAPGIDIQTQIIDLMGFVPKMEKEVRLMDERIFKNEPMGLSK
ncbi:acyl CoA:acetate/3-ketoacid CoA transferase [Anaerotignum propionicum]|uniref:acyl CoA:acetate/3-ketoacid CoA transferase n=1 Tax=Anaerotignum propionicum TaxID=28446 RepID=UPI002897AF02|nr:acyl CoA:acetate/3-ketoacid CoA transferase [Anaerotignum propionicum]